MGYLDGFGVTIKKWLGPGTDTGRRVTTEYPEQTRPKPERFHGRHVLNRYDDGMEKCIGCELCAGVCPARCIYVRGRDNDPDDPTSPGERYGFIYEINYLRCIHCDLCVEACPTEAITETKLFEFAFTNRADAIYTKDELVVDDDGRPQQLPWENWEGGFDPAQDTSGWMRATAPSGDAEFVGIVAWAGELGYGVRAPEGGGRVEAEVAADLPAQTAAGASAAAVGATSADSVRGAFDAGDGVAVPAATASTPATTTTTAPEPVEPVEELRSTEVSAQDDVIVDRSRTAGAFDAPMLDEEPRRFGRGRRRGADDALPADTGPTDEEVVASLPEDFGAGEGEPPADGDLPDAGEDAVSDTDTESAGTESADTEDAGPAAPPARGSFDAPIVAEEPKGRRFRRRGGDT